MAKISILNALRARRRFRIFTLLACAILFVVLGQIIVNQSPKNVKAAGWNGTCVLNDATSDSIPEWCGENSDVTINSNATIYLDKFPVWQDSLKHYECPPTRYDSGSGITYTYGYLSGSTCWYTHNIVASPQLSNDYYPLWYGIDRTCPSHSYRGTEYAFTGATWLTGSGTYGTRVCQYALAQSDTIIKTSQSASLIDNVKGKNCSARVNSVTGYKIEPDLAPNCDTKRQFKKLILSNGAVLTHQGLSIGDMYEDVTALGGVTNGSLADNTKGEARWRKVDLKITGTLQLNGGAQVNANEKGYPQNTPANDPYGGDRGYGPGGGIDISSDNNSNQRGGGAGYGNYGYRGIEGNTARGISYGTVTVLPFEWGSAGGFAERRDGGHEGLGGTGGGRIKLEVNKLDISNGTSITANGGNGGAGDKIQNGGGGSGGSIVIVTNEYTGNVPVIHAENRLYDRSGYDINLNGSVNVATFVSSSGSSYYTYQPLISAFGGYSGVIPTVTDTSMNSGLASGGRIYIQQTGAAKVSIKKTLYPIKRGGVVDTSFNPYALQVGDIIKVQLDLGSFSGTVSVRDDYLYAPSSGATLGVRCKNDTTSGSPTYGGKDQASTYMSWTGISSGNTPLVYYCKVQ